MRYSLLKHTNGDDCHVDFLLDYGQEKLLCWQISDLKLLQMLPGDLNFSNFSKTQNAAIDKIVTVAKRIFDHRNIYLDYEGEISGQRGFVTQLDSGQWELKSLTQEQLTLKTTNSKHGDFGKLWVFRFPSDIVCTGSTFSLNQLGTLLPLPSDADWELTVIRVC